MTPPTPPQNKQQQKATSNKQKQKQTPPPHPHTKPHKQQQPINHPSNYPTNQTKHSKQTNKQTNKNKKSYLLRVRLDLLEACLQDGARAQVTRIHDPAPCDGSGPPFIGLGHALQVGQHGGREAHGARGQGGASPLAQVAAARRPDHGASFVAEAGARCN